MTVSCAARFVLPLVLLAGCVRGPTAPPLERAPGPTANDPEPASERAARLYAEGEAVGFTPTTCAQTAEAFAEAAREAGPSGALLHYRAGLSYEQCGDAARARPHYARAVRLGPEACAPRVALGVADFRLGRAAQASASFRGAIENDPTCGAAYLNLGALARREGRPAEAITQLRRALAVDASDLAAMNEMALAWLDRAEERDNAADLAEVVCQQAVQIDPRFGPIHNTWGLIAVHRGYVVEALSRFERAFTVDPGLFEAWMNFGQITLSFRGYDDAERAFRAALELRADHYDALIGLGVALRGLERLDEAERTYELARQLDAGRPEAWFNLGILYHDHRDGTEADLEEAQARFNDFLERASASSRYAEAVEEVSRTCGARRRGCRPGRLALIRMTLAALRQGRGAAPAPAAAAPTPKT